VREVMIARRASNRPKVQELQRRLYLSAKSRGTTFYSLYDKIYREDVLNEAWCEVKANRGTGGVDGETIEDIVERGEHRFIGKIQHLLSSKGYKPNRVKRVYIPKRDGRKRPLGIPTVIDRVVQAAVRIVIEPIFEAGFEDCSYGFRPKRSARQACAEIYKLLNFGCEQVIDADLKSYFETIPHQELMRLIAEKICDRNILKLIKLWLKAGVLDGNDIYPTVQGVPQGGVISPLLSNIYLNQLDKIWKARGYDKRSGYNAHLIRYADDFVVISNRDLKSILKILKQMIETLGLELNEEKTKIVHAGDGFDFLGFRFVRRMNPWKTKVKSYVFPTPESMKRIREKIRNISNYRAPITPEEIVEKVNPLLKGWANYYVHTNAGKSFGLVQKFVNKRIRRFLRRRRHKKGMGYRQYPDEFLYKRLGLLRINSGFLHYA
jgi:group II intron reverse transcriptase/maturase